MRNILARHAVALFVGLSASALLAACSGAILPVGQESPSSDAGPSKSDTGAGKDGGGKSGGCTGTNPGCCNPVCNEPNPEATCSNGAWTCPAGDSVGPECPAICEVVDGGAPTACTGTNPGCCSTDCSPGFTPPKATCSAGTWTCPTGDTVGPVCPLICSVDGGLPGSNDAGLPCCKAGQGWGGLPTTPAPSCEGCCAGLTEESSVVGPGDIAYTCVSSVDAGSGCTGTAPSCCGLNAQGCEAVLGTATCAEACPAGDCSSPWAWTCPANETVANACPTYCVALDAGAPDAGSACPGTAPTCCEVGNGGFCEMPVGVARCSSTGVWACGNGSEHPPVICGVGCLWGDAGSACSDPEPSCCFPPPLCDTLVAAPACSGGSWVCPSGSTATQGVCTCAATDAGL